MARQQSIPGFSDEEQAIVDEAMRVEHIDKQGQWVRRAAILWARHVLDESKNTKVLDAIKALELRVDIAEDNIRSSLTDIEVRLPEISED